MPGINRKFFFLSVRQSLFFGSLSKGQVANAEKILDYWESNHAPDDDRWLAYVFATVYHEVGANLAPIHEIGTKAYFMMKYDISKNPKVAKSLGNHSVGDGYTYRGRGYVQLTGRSNYQHWSEVLGKDLIGNPDLALEPQIAVEVLIKGMILGSFRGYKLADFFSEKKHDPVNARAIVNGDVSKNGKVIAQHALRFYQAISYTT